MFFVWRARILAFFPSSTVQKKPDIKPLETQPIQDSSIFNIPINGKPKSPNGIDCSIFPDKLKKEKSTDYESKKLTWNTFGSVDPTSDYDFSIDIEYPDFDYNKNLNFNERMDESFWDTHKQLIERQL